MSYVIGVLVLAVTIQGVVIVALLISRARRARVERVLRESEARFRLMADRAPVMIWTARPDTTLDYLNSTCVEFTGLPIEQLLDEGWLAAVHAEDREHCVRIYSPAVATRTPFLMEYRLRRADGSYRWVLDSGVPKYGPDGGFTGYIGCCIDVSERKRAEYELLQQRQELAHLNRISTLGELAASMAHELNQPLTAILSNAQAGQRFLRTGSGADTKEIHDVLQDIIEDNHRAAHVIRRLRSLAKKEDLEFVTLDIETAMREVALLLHNDAVLHNVHVSLEFQNSLPPVRGDRVQLQQVALNLLLNAFDAMKGTPAHERQVVVRAEPAEARAVTVAVRDSGTGVSDELLDRIFESFYTTKREGLGMGLSISRSIIQAHGGRLWAENNADRGVTFYFTVPTDGGQALSTASAY